MAAPLHALALRRIAGGVFIVAIASLPFSGQAKASGPEPEPEADEAPSEGQVALDAASAAVDEGDYEKALDEYRRAKELDASLNVDEPLAMAHFQIGTTSYSKGHYEKALESFQDAQGLYPSPNFHYNIAQCYEALERPQQAIDSYRAFLRAVPETNDRANIESKIARLEKQLQAEKDERSKPQNESRPVAQPATPARDQPKHPGRVMIITGGLLTGVGAAVGLGGGLAFGLSARNKGRQVNDVFEGGNPEGLTFAQTEELEESGRRAQTNQIILSAAGGAVAAVGIALLAVGLVEKNKSKKLNATAGFGPGFGSLSLQGRF
jgi:tetratricopeptide (TPR) repeat protein